MRKLTLFNEHKRIGAKMVDFAGYYMPLQYEEGVIKEHIAVRESVGIFDVSHMGEVFIRGEKSEMFLQYITSNDVSRLEIGDVQYTCLINYNGGIVDDLLLYKLEKDYYLLVLNAANIQKDIDWINSCNTDQYNIDIDNKSHEYSLLAVQGPKTLELLMEHIDIDISDLKYYKFRTINIAGIENILISRTGYTGELGFELYVKNECVKMLWDILFSSSIKLNPIGLAARDTLRLEKGFCLYGNDINDDTSPIEAGLGWITKFSKDFIGSDILFKQANNGVSRKLVGMKLIDRGIARKGYSISDASNQNIGTVTSGTISPTLQKSIAMGYVLPKYQLVGSEVFIKIRNKKVKAKIVNLPFVK